MRVERTASGAFTLEFESEQELQEEHRTNLSFRAVRLPTDERVTADETVLLTLRGPWGGEAFVRAKVVAVLPDGLALALDGEPEQLLGRLLERAQPEAEEPRDAEESTTRRQTDWDRIRGLSHMDKILIAVKAERTDRALLMRESDPRVLLSLLRNPRITIDEVARMAKSPVLTYDIADVIMKAAQWMANRDVQLGLIHNPKTPPAFALRILSMLPESEVRIIARTGTNMALKQAALRRLQGKL